MKKLFTLAATLVLICGMALSAQAALITITFDEEGIDYREMITDQYADYGIYWDAAYSNEIVLGADSNIFGHPFESDGQILRYYGDDESRGVIRLDTLSNYLSFDFRRPNSAASIYLALYDTSSGEDFLVWDFGSIGWSGDDWWTFTYDGLYGGFDKIVMYCEKKFVIDNLTVDTAYTAVPIPPSVLLLGAGLIPLIFRRRKTINV